MPTVWNKIVIYKELSQNQYHNHIFKKKNEIHQILNKKFQNFLDYQISIWEQYTPDFVDFVCFFFS